MSVVYVAGVKIVETSMLSVQRGVSEALSQL